MAKRDPDTVQLKFENGNLVERSTEGESPTDEQMVDPIEPGDQTGFVVEVKAGAIDVNNTLPEDIETHGWTLDFGSRAHAEAYASQLSALDGSLRIQAAPENEPDDIDAYLLADHTPSITEPADIDGKTWTFDVGANLYGTLGEAILTSAPKPYALYYFVRRDLEIDDGELESGLALEVETSKPILVDLPNGAKRWTPDCVVQARDGWDGRVLARYYCEIKTGNASFERSQVTVMEELAKTERVLKIRVRIDDLPDQYSLRIHEVVPSE
jgi:hypothetical protein